MYSVPGIVHWAISKEQKKLLPWVGIALVGKISNIRYAVPDMPAE